MLQLPRSAAFLANFQRFWGSFSHKPPDSLQSAEMFFTDFLLTFSLAYIPNLGPVGSSPVPVLLRAKMQFSASFSHETLDAQLSAATLLRRYFIFYILFT